NTIVHGLPFLAYNMRETALGSEKASGQMGYSSSSIRLPLQEFETVHLTFDRLSDLRVASSLLPLLFWLPDRNMFHTTAFSLSLSSSWHTSRRSSRTFGLRKMAG